MGRKRLGILFLASIILAFLTGFFSSAVIPQLPTGPGGNVFEEITQKFQNYYYYDIDDEQIQAAFIAAMRAMIDSYAQANNDPYTRLVGIPLNVSPTNDEQFIGMGISFFAEGNDMRVSYVMPNGAAAGLLYPNDLITGVIDSGNRVYFADLDSKGDALSYLRGELGDVKRLIVVDPDLLVSEVDITYIEIKTPTAYTMDLGDDNIAYIRITRFSGFVEGSSVGTSKIFKDLLNELEASFLLDDSTQKTLIIDLRDNPGGALTALHNSDNAEIIPGIAQQLLVNDIERPLFQMIDRTGVANNYHGGLVNPLPYNIVVLVNERSASAAEVLAAALQTNGNFLLYGTPTLGKAVFQNRIDLRIINNVRYSLVFTQGRWFFDNGKNVIDNPLEVNLIKQEGIKTLTMPIYMGTVSFNEVSTSLRAYQIFLNYYFGFVGLDKLRTDGFFDSATQNAFMRFQSEFGIAESGVLDLLTARIIHDLFVLLYYDSANDVQLHNLVSILQS